MATIRKRGNRYHVQIRKTGQPPLTKSFAKKADAQTWANTVESEMERGLFLDTSEAEATTVGSLIDRYEREVLPSKRSRQGVLYHLGQVKQGLGEVPLAKLLPSDLATYRDKRLTQAGPQSVLHELRLVQRILNTATKDWGIYLPHGNPVTQVRLPKLPKGRDRRLELEEQDRLLEVFENNLVMRSLVLFAIESGMRRGEISNMQWEHINWNSQTLQIPETKTDIPREIPLSNIALEKLKMVKQVVLTQLVCDPPTGSTPESLRELQEHMTGPVWGLRPDSITQAFERACKRAGIEDLRFHDLRHEATSRFFEKGLNTMEVSSITGHQDLRMLKRYTHIRAESLVSRL